MTEKELNNMYEQLKKEVKKLNFTKTRCCNEYMRKKILLKGDDIE